MGMNSDTKVFLWYKENFLSRTGMFDTDGMIDESAIFLPWGVKIFNSRRPFGPISNEAVTGTWNNRAVPSIVKTVPSFVLFNEMPISAMPKDFKIWKIYLGWRHNRNERRKRHRDLRVSESARKLVLHILEDDRNKQHIHQSTGTIQIKLSHTSLFFKEGINEAIVRTSRVNCARAEK